MREVEHAIVHQSVQPLHFSLQNYLKIRNAKQNRHPAHPINRAVLCLRKLRVASHLPSGNVSSAKKSFIRSFILCNYLVALRNGLRRPRSVARANEHI
jgi:hypothetical protein